MLSHCQQTSWGISILSHLCRKPGVQWSGGLDKSPLPFILGISENRQHPLHITTDSTSPGQQALPSSPWVCLCFNTNFQGGWAFICLSSCVFGLCAEFDSPPATAMRKILPVRAGSRLGERPVLNQGTQSYEGSRWHCLRLLLPASWGRGEKSRGLEFACLGSRENGPLYGGEHGFCRLSPPLPPMIIHPECLPLLNSVD